MIRRLRLKNFKCFHHVTVDLGPLTLLSGMNSTGKTSLFHALLLLRQSHQRGFTPETGLVLDGELIQVGSARDLLCEGAGEDVIGWALTEDDGDEEKWVFDYKGDASVMKPAMVPREKAIYGANLFNKNFQYVGAERIGPRNAFEMSDAWVRRRGQLGPRGQYAAHYLSEYKNKRIVEDVLAHPGEESRYLGDQVEAWLGEISPGVRLHLQPHPEMGLVDLEYSFASGAHVSNRFRTAHSGYGLTAALPILIALLTATKDSLILLENPEEHLHPMARIRIGELIALAVKCGAQVIVETHGDHLLNGVRLSVYEKIIEPGDAGILFFFFLEKEEASPISIHTSRMDETGAIDQWPAGYFDTWNNSLKELLKPRSSS